MKNNIRIERAKRDMTQAELADKAKVSRQTVNAMEKGNYDPSTVLALRLASIFETEVGHLFELEAQDWE